MFIMRKCVLKCALQFFFRKMSPVAGACIGESLVCVIVCVRMCVYVYICSYICIYTYLRICIGS